ncbi:hypothetical protein DC20_05985 [Rufibacter tibetensis]|uniref:Uncharacterized protein n=1 Tax=Rufibacter tibetensis TaxID=512763 RepID=A0A0P0CQC3_9BACT|nr:hypothetical protein DC20_05985 [Rufibacter tibetensis]
MNDSLQQAKLDWLNGVFSTHITSNLTTVDQQTTSVGYGTANMCIKLQPEEQLFPHLSKKIF